MNTQNTNVQRLGLPNLGLGVGLRTKHFPYLLSNTDPLVDWFEIISENFIDNYGYARYALQKIAEKRPIVMHGVSMNLGSVDPLNKDYLSKLKVFAKEIQAKWISDHLCWTGVNNVNTHDLLPLPLNEESLSHVTQKILQIQDYLEQPIVLENPSTYIEFKESTISEWDFLSELAKTTGCGLLLDVNNVYVSSFNHGYDPELYIKTLPHSHIVQIHIAGPSDCGDYMIDTHDHPVPSKVWELYKLAQELTEGVSTLLEWDAKIPEYPELVAELMKAKEVLQGNLPNVNVATSQTAFALSNPIDFHIAQENG